MMVGFTSGDFAEICGVKKATLFHYDEIGILKPSFVGENGYRYYTDKDVYTYDAITALKEVGYTLSEIKEYLAERNPERFIAILKNGRRLLDAQRKKIDRLDRVFSTSLSTTREALRSTIGRVQYREEGDEFLIVHEAAENPTVFNKETFMKAREHITYCHERDLAHTMPIGLIIKAADLGCARIHESWYFSKTNTRMSDSHFQLKPAGLYAVLYHQGNYDSLTSACHKLKKSIAAKGCSIIGEVYEEDQLSFFTTKEEDGYLLKVSARIRKSRTSR
jgi:DNA-binding transcriptional MerR regulator/effector-binding domain-containing protein